MRNSILSLLILFTFASCSFSVGTDVKAKVRTIDGVNYGFSNITKHKKFNIFLIQGDKFDNQIDFSGLDKYINREINKADFEKKVNLDDVESIQIDSVSFDVNSDRNKVDLIYYLNLDNSNKTAVFTLLKNDDEWSLN